VKDKRLEKEERRRPLVEVNLASDSRARSSWPPRSKSSSAKKGSSLGGRLSGVFSRRRRSS
jgi:hypothetical protein